MSEIKYATLKMKKSLTKQQPLSAYTYECLVYKYEEKEASIYLNVKDPLTEISLDAIYECKVQGTKIELAFTGRVVERYISESGNMIHIKIEAGFYKKTIK